MDKRIDLLQAGAVIDPTGTYRYHLTRSPDPGRGGRVTWIMLNPSTADAQMDDPTLRRCLGFCRAWGYGALEVVNLFALRTSHPWELFNHPQPIGPENDAYLRQVIKDAELVVAAWGSHGCHLGRANTVRHMLAQLHPNTLCLGLTKPGEPLHPLYIPGETRLIPLPISPFPRPSGAKVVAGLR